MSQGDEQIAFYKRAITDFNDCYYGDGVQVGPLARYRLGKLYLELGRNAEAKALFDEIRANYPDAVNHDGSSLLAQLPIVPPHAQGVEARQVYVAANSPYYQAMLQMAADLGLQAGPAFNTSYDAYCA